MMRVLVCGGRNYGNLARLKDNRDHADWPRLEEEYNHVMRTLDKIAVEKSKFYDPNDNWLPSDMEIISGKATGADSVAIDWAVVNWCSFKEFEAKWDDMTAIPCVPRRNKFGKLYNAAAGSIRNQRMIDEGKPDLVVAFPGGRGTADMVRRARAAGIEVREIA